MRQLHPELIPARGDIDPARVDVNNVLMLIVVLPALAVIAARLSGLRQKLKDQRLQLRSALAEVERLATSDELTGLPNRRSIKLHLERSLALSSRNVAPTCIAILDIDHFKAINDELGHAQGYVVLREFARLAGSGLRATDLLGRWGGEEFLLLLPGGCDGMACVLERVRAGVRDGCSTARPVTFSAGIAQHQPGETLDELLARADSALYRAKASGRDRSFFADC